MTIINSSADVAKTCTDWDLILARCILGAQQNTYGNSLLSLKVEAVTEGDDEYFEKWIDQNRRRDKGMTTPKELPTSTQQMGVVGNRPKEGGRGKNLQKGGVTYRERNSSCSQSHSGRRTLPRVIDGQNRCREEIREMAHERIMELQKTCTIPHFFSEDIRHICLASNMC